MHECVYNAQVKDGFQLLCIDGQSSKIQLKFILKLISLGRVAIIKEKKVDP